MLSLLEKNKKLTTLKQRKDFDLLKRQSVSFSYQWLRIFLYIRSRKVLKVAWSVKKTYISQAVVRNRLKRWGRENLKASSLSGFCFVVFLKKKDKNFYKRLKRKEFDDVFKALLEKVTGKSLLYLFIFHDFIGGFL